MQRRFERSNTDRVIAGVCGGLAQYLAVDATLVRVAFVVLTIVTAFLWVLVYLVLLILMPLPGERAPIDDIWPTARGAAAPPSAADGETAASTQPIHPPLDRADADRRMSTIGYILVALGFVFLLANLGMFSFIRWNVIWPVVIIAVGALLLLRRARP